MDIYTAVNASQKLYDFISKYSNQGRNMYKSTRDKLDKIRIQSENISDKITSIIQDSDFMSEQSFDASSDISTLSDALTCIFKVRKFIDSYSETNSTQNNTFKCLIDICRDIYQDYDENSYIYDENLQMIKEKLEDISSKLFSVSEPNCNLPKNVETEVQEVSDENISSNDGLHSSSSNNKKAMSCYNKAFSTLKKSSIPYKDVIVLRNILYRWFTVRFRNGFRYKLEDFKQWVVAIISSFGYSIQTDSMSNYDRMFNDWLDQIEKSPDRFSLPYEVFEFYKHPNADYNCTISHILYDILYDYGLKFATKDEPLYLNDDIMSTWENNHKLSMLYEYDHYKYQPDIVSKCKIS